MGRVRCAFGTGETEFRLSCCGCCGWLLGCWLLGGGWLLGCGWLHLTTIGFHPLHTLWPILFYLVLLIPDNTWIFGLGLCIHIALDMIDCELNGNGLCLEDLLY